MNQTMNVSVPKNLARLAKEQVKAGYYSSVSEVIRTALRQLLLSSGNIPTFPMSLGGERRALDAIKDYKKGKATEITSFKELGS